VTGEREDVDGAMTRTECLWRMWCWQDLSGKVRRPTWQLESASLHREVRQDLVQFNAHFRTVASRAARLDDERS
jgi:hypothetical protein